MIGNTNLTLQNYSDTRLNSNNTMIKVDADGITSTNNSSSSTLAFSTENGAVPSCSKILFAGLYWTARTDNNVTELAKRTVKFRGPNQSAYTSYTALSNEIRYPGDDNMYVAFTEVTSQVQQCGLGEYWVADMALTTGDGGNAGYYGGWGMVVVYENSKMVKRDITVFDGYAYVIGGTASWELPVSGFNSTLSGNVNMKLGMIAGEGDVTITGDKFEIQKLNTPSWQLLNHSANTTDNFFNSSIFTGGNSRNPNLKNNTGVDISMFSIPNANNQTIANGQSSTKFRYSSTQDTYIIYSICMAVDAYEPAVEGILTTQSINQIPVTSPNITVLPGDQIQYKVQVKNTGNEAINNAQLKIPLPYAAIKYIGSTVQVFPPASGTSQPFVDLGMGANGTLVWNIGTLPKPVNPNTVLGEIVFTLKVSQDCDLYKNFKCAAPSVDIDGTVSGTGANTGISVNDQPFYVGFSNTNGCTTEPITGPYKININATAWTNANCQNQSDIRDFSYCNRTTPIEITEVLGFYPNGTRFFNNTQTIEYTISNPFPNVAGPTTYYAQLPNSSCVLSFRIAVNTISSIPIVTPGTREFCQNGTSTILQATPSNPSYSLYYYAPGNPAIQPFILPATDVAGDFVYQVAEGPSSTCISINRANLPVKILPQPSITATANQIACFGATGSVSLSSSGGTGTLTYSSSNPSLTNLNAGTYIYEVSDSKGCTNTASAVINPAPAQPQQPVIACWQTATWNSATCSWDVTGTQPTQPTGLSCWQSANFNTSTCSWDVTGTQPTQPTGLSCWQLANFNTSTCSWDVTGTQPSEPTGLSCWQSANFNTITCSWDVTGTQPAEPTAQNCWDNYQFSTSSCSWVNIGSPAPLQTTTASACGSYLWTVNNQTYTSSGTFDFSENCQDYSLNLTITPIQSDTVRVSACDSYTWNGTAYTQSGTYTINGNCENTCSQGEVSPYNCANTSGYTSTISTNTSDVNVGPGQVVRITAASFTRNLNISGGTLVICGSASPQNINMNTNGNTFLMVINGSVVLNNLNLPSKASIANYGSLTLNNSVGFSGTIKNYGSLTCQADFNVNSGGAFYNYATAMLLNHNNSNISENRGTLQIGNRLQNNGGSSLLNTCTMNVGNEFINNAFARNEGNLEIQQMLRINGGSILEIAAGKVVKTKNLNLDGTVRGTGSGLSRLAVSGSSLINSSGKLEGTSSLCDANGVETNNGQVISPALISCTGSPSSNSCCSSSTLILTITPSVSNTTQVNACQSYTWSANNTTYTNSGTYTSVNACETSVLQLTISNPPQPPRVNCWDNFVFNSESCSWINTGTQPSSPTNLACWQSANFNTSTCSWDVTGTQPAQPTGLSCWQSANFNTSTCSWDVAGTQPTQPTGLACWQSANFNTATCSWVVSGTQPAEPTNLACWQSANFDTATCSWDVTGTQPAQPTNLSCWQSANFNTSTCSWDVTGTQPTQPTGLSCWQSANFNTATCSWDVTGTQPAQPTNLACWQSANFNTATCSWVVSGTQPVKPTEQNCWDNFLFQTSSCSWVNTGSPSPLQTTTASACDSYLWTVNNQTYTNSGTFNFSANCQDYQLVLTITPAQRDTTRIISCGPYQWNGATYTQSGTYTVSATCCKFSVVNFLQGPTRSGGQVPLIRSVANNALVPQKSDVNDGTINFFSLGYRGYITLMSGCPINNGLGNDVKLWETTWPPSSQYPSGERARLFASQDGVTYVDLGLAIYDTEFDLGSLAWAKYFRIVDETPYENSDDAFDVDGIEVLNGFGAATCCNTSTLVLTINPNVNPVSAGQISGSTNSCAFTGTGGSLATYSVSATNATAFNWTVPSGATSVSGQGTASISFRFPSTFTSGSVAVSISGCGGPISRSIAVSKTAPTTPAAINGPANVCAFRGTTTAATYSVSAVANATSYNWAVPAGISIQSGAGSSSIQVLIASTFCGGNISVVAASPCGNSAARSLALNVSIPATPGTITGTARACPGNVYTYSVAAVTNATSYHWTVPAGSTIVSGAGTNSISLSFGSGFTASGTLSVKAANGCGSSTARSLSITRNAAATPSVISGQASGVCGLSSVSYTVKAVAGITYNWTGPSGVTILSGQGTASMSVRINSGFTTGNLMVTASNGCGTSTARTLCITSIAAVPASITGAASAAAGSVQTYSTAAVTGAISYTWTVPTGWTIQSGQGTASITVKAGTNGGSLTVRSVNSCGSSSTRSLTVSVGICARMAVAEESLPEISLNAYPNPFRDGGIHVAFTGMEERLIVAEIMDVHGREVLRKEFKTESEIHLQPQVPAGIYTLRISDAQQVLKVFRIQKAQ